MQREVKVDFGHLYSSICFLCPPELQQRLPEQRGMELDWFVLLHGSIGGQGCRWQLWSWMFLTTYKFILFMEDCLQKAVPPSCLQKKLIFGEGIRVAALCLVSLLLLVFFRDLFGTATPLASVSLRICHVKKSCLRWCMIR